MKKNKVKCPLCNSRKPARTCISLGKEICSRCCGERRNESNCIKECEHFKVFIDDYNLSIYKCVNMGASGMNSIFLAREKSDGSLIVASYLADTLEAGLKDSFIRKCSKTEFHNMIVIREKKSGEKFREISFEECQKIVKTALRINPISKYPMPYEFNESKKYLGDLDKVKIGGSIFRCMLCGSSLDQKTDQFMKESIHEENFGFAMICDKCKEKNKRH